MADLRPIHVLKADYFNGLGSLKTLAAIHRIPERTVFRYASREGWAQKPHPIIKQLSKSIADTANAGTATAIIGTAKSAIAGDSTAIAGGIALGRRAIGFISRSIDEAENLLARMRELAAKPGLTPVDFRHLASGFETVVNVGRRAFGLDQACSQPAHPMLLVQSLQTAVQVMPAGHGALSDAQPEPVAIDVAALPTGSDNSSDQVDAPDASTVPAKPESAD